MAKTVKESNAYKRLTALFDDGLFTEIDAYAKSADGDIEVVAGYGCVNGVPVYSFAQDSSVNGGAISIAQCSKIKKIYQLATKTGCPVISIYDSNGVKLTEGFEVLSAYGEIIKYATSVSGVVPQISIVDGACLGACAIMANIADIVIATKESDFYITAPSDISIEDSSKAGTIDVVADDFDSAVNTVSDLIAILPQNNLSGSNFVNIDFSEPATVTSNGMTAAQITESIFDADSFVELKSAYAQNVVTAIGTISGCTVGVVAFDGKPLCASCAYKAEALIKLCDAFNIPIVTVANANGLASGAENQILVAATKLTSAYASATSPKISIVAGNSIGSAYLILAGKGANADVTVAWDSAVASPLEVESAVAFLFNDRLAAGEDRATLENEYKETIGSPFTAGACGAVEDVIAPQETRAKVAELLDMLSGKRETTIPRKHSVK